MKKYDCKGYKSLLAAVNKDIEEENLSFKKTGRKFRKDEEYLSKLDFAITKAEHYADKTGLTVEFILDKWEEKRTYWYMNYYQEYKQPRIKGDKVKVFNTTSEAAKTIGKTFRCPSCGKISTNPNTCDGCNWCAGGFLRTLGKGLYLFIKEDASIYEIFMPTKYEKGVNDNEAN